MRSALRQCEDPPHNPDDATDEEPDRSDEIRNYARDTDEEEDEAETPRDAERPRPMAGPSGRGVARTDQLVEPTSIDWVSPLWISTFRGLAFSATGTVTWSTPWS